VSTADAVQREADWLGITTDSLPALLTSAGGSWDIVQAYWPGARLAAMKTGVYVLRRRTRMPREGGQRILPGYSFLLKLCWPVKNVTGTSSVGTGLAEGEQQAFDDAIDLLLQRVDGLPGDKTHGGRFQSVGETPPGTYPEVDYADPEQTIPMLSALRATVTYNADDLEIFG
jgi:hypothetical protein